MVNKYRVAYTKWMLAFSNPYEKGTQEYKDADDVRTLILGAAMGSLVIGAVIGFFLGLVF